MNMKRFAVWGVLSAIVLSLYLIFNGSGSPQPALISFPYLLDDRGQLPGEFSGTDTTFAVRNSRYRDVAVVFDKKTKAHVESIPGMLALRLESKSGAKSVSISNLAPSTTYYKYTDHLDSKEVITTDETGAITFSIDSASQPYIMIFEHPSTYFIDDDGGDCDQIGTWDGSAKTCTLTKNIDQSIEIKDNGITLDGANHVVQGPDSNIGVFVNGGFFGDITDVTVKNLTVQDFSKGVQINNTNRVQIINVTAKNNADGVEFHRAENSSITLSNITNNSSKGLIVGDSSDVNDISRNTITGNNLGISLGLNSQSGITRNNIKSNGTGIGIGAIGGNNTYLWQNNIGNPQQVSILFDGDTRFNKPLPDRGNFWSDHDCTRDQSNLDFCTNPYIISVPILSDKSDELPWACENAWLTSVTCSIKPSPTPTKTPTATPTPAPVSGDWGEIISTPGNINDGVYFGDSALTKKYKHLPNGYVFEILDGATSPVKVRDPGDQSEGFVPKANIRIGVNAAEIADFQKKGTTNLTTEVLRASAVLDAVNLYFSNTSTTPNLYSSNDADIQSFVADSGFVKEVILAKYAHEGGGSLDFNNELMTFDYGHGPTQITVQPYSKDVTYLQIMLKKLGYLSVDPTGDFKDLTEAGVTQFQTAKGATPINGKVYSLTINKLNETLNDDRGAYPGIPAAFEFRKFMVKNLNKDRTGAYDNRGTYSKIKVYPCANIGSEVASDAMKYCYRPNNQNGSFYLYSANAKQGTPLLSYYTNNPQGIFANIKDGLGILRSKYYEKDQVIDNSPSTRPWASENGVTINDKELKSLLALRGYNGFGFAEPNPDPAVKDCKNVLNSGINPNYLGEIAAKTLTLSQAYDGKVTSFTTDTMEYKILKLADKNKTEICVESPVYVQIINEQGLMTGWNGSANVDQIPQVAYDTNNHEGASIIFPRGKYAIRLVGTQAGTYNLIVANYSNSNTGTLFESRLIPIQRCSIHEYTFDWVALKQGKEGTILKMDQNCDGKFEQSVTGGLSMNPDLINNVMVCHVPPGNPQNAHTLNIGKSALKAHLGHGDYDGPCTTITPSLTVTPKTSLTPNNGTAPLPSMLPQQKGKSKKK